MVCILLFLSHSTSASSPLGIIISSAKLVLDALPFFFFLYIIYFRNDNFNSQSIQTGDEFRATLAHDSHNFSETEFSSSPPLLCVWLTRVKSEFSECTRSSSHCQGWWPRRIHCSAADATTTCVALPTPAAVPAQLLLLHPRAVHYGSGHGESRGNRIQRIQPLLLHFLTGWLLLLILLLCKSGTSWIQLHWCWLAVFISFALGSSFGCFYYFFLMN